MNENGELFFISGFRPLDFDTYTRGSLDKLPEGIPSCIKMGIIDEEPGEKMHSWSWIEGESINGIHIRILDAKSVDDPQMSVFIPWMASGMDIYLAYAFMNTVLEKHPTAFVTACDVEGNNSGEKVSISDEERDNSFLERINIIAMLLELPEKFVNIPCMAGQWRMDIKKYQKELADKPLEEQVTKVLYDIIDYIWYQSPEE